MATKNDVTGDTIATKGVLSEQGRDNWDRIFGKKEPEKVEETAEQEGEPNGEQ